MTKTTGFIAFILMGLSVLIWFQLNEPSQEETINLSLTELQLSDITALKIEGKYSVSLERRGSDWFLKNGRRADSNVVQKSLNAIKSLDFSELITSQKEKFKELKVDETQGTRVLAYSGPQVVADFVIGSAGAGGANIRSGSNVYAMKGMFPGTFARPLAAWAERRLMRAKVSDVSKVEIKLAGEESLVLLPSEDEVPVWSLSDPSVLPADFLFDALTARSVVKTVLGLSVREFVEGPKQGSEVFSQADQIMVHFKDKSRETQTVLLGKKLSEKLVYAKRMPGDETFILSAHSAQLLRRKISDYRDLRVMRFDIPSVVGLRIKQGEAEFAMNRKESRWMVDKANPAMPVGFEVSDRAVLGLLESIRELRGAGIVQEPRSEFGKVSKAIELALEDGSQAILEFGRTFKFGSEDAVYVRGNRDTFSYYLPKASVTPLQTDILSMGAQKTSVSPPAGSIDMSSLSHLPPEAKEQLMRQIQGERRKQEMLKAFEKQKTVRETK